MCLNKRLFDRLIAEVGAWSHDNFGHQTSKWQTPKGPSNVSQQLCLGHVAPLLGIIEECGELKEAYSKGDKELVRDSIGDIFIYLADYFYRTNLGSQWIDWDLLQRDIPDTTPGRNFSPDFLAGRDENGTYISLSVNHDDWRPDFLPALGKLVHANLKRHQGIRGYDGDKFFVELQMILTDLIQEIRLCYIGISERPLTVQEATDAVMTTVMSIWGHVKERNWNKNPATGS